MFSLAACRILANRLLGIVINFYGEKSPVLFWTPCCDFHTHNPNIKQRHIVLLGARGGKVGWGTVLQPRRSGVQFPMLSLAFFIDTILLAALWPWGRLRLQQNCVSGIFRGGKGGRCVGLTTLPHSCADCLEIWEPQPPGTLRASPGL